MKRCRRFVGLALGLLPVLALAQAMPADVAGGKDHPALTRYAGSWLVATDNKAFDATAFPAGPKEGEAAQLEGRIARLFYLAPAGRSVLEVQRNYEQALEKAGATRRDACAMPACGARSFGFLGGGQGKQLAAGSIDDWGTKSLVDQWIDHDSVRWWYGALNAQGTTLHVSVLSAKQGLVALADKWALPVLPTTHRWPATSPTRAGQRTGASSW